MKNHQDNGYVNRDLKPWAFRIQSRYCKI